MTALVVRAGALRCALPLACVEETMRPLALTPLRGAPDFVLGVALVRGAAAPVVDLARLLCAADAGPPRRLVTLRSAAGRIAAAVSEVVGVRELSGALAALPPLLQGAAPELLQALARLDGELLAVLSGGWALPDEIWEAALAVSPRP